LIDQRKNLWHLRRKMNPYQQQILQLVVMAVVVAGMMMTKRKTRMMKIKQVTQ